MKIGRKAMAHGAFVYVHVYVAGTEEAAICHYRRYVREELPP